MAKQGFPQEDLVPCPGVLWVLDGGNMVAKGRVQQQG